MDEKRVYDYFLLFTDLPEEEGERWRWLCRQAAIRLKSRLRPTTNLQCPETQDRLATAAAACAWADYLVIQGGGAGTGEEIRVGDISVKSSHTGDARRDTAEILDSFLGQVGDLLLPDREVFWQVEAL